LRRSARTSKVIFPQKKRHVVSNNENTLCWGTFGYRLIHRFFCGHRKLLLIHKNLKKIYISKFAKLVIKSVFNKKQAYRRSMRVRTYWCYIRNLQPITKKSSKARMGKGRGKLRGYVGTMRAGRILYEFLYSNTKLVRKITDYFQRQFSGYFILIKRLDFKTITLFTNRTYSYYNRLEYLFSRKKKIKTILHWRMRKHLQSI